jgi:ATP-dependent DNA helicase UvrD/PcrA
VGKKLTPELAALGVTLRNEDRDVGGASIQDLMTEPYAQVIVDTLDLLSRRRGGGAWVRVLEHYAGMEGILANEDPEGMQDISTKLGEFHVQSQVGNPDDTVEKSHVEDCIDKIEAFFGLGALKALAPQYVQGDFFDRIRSATKAFLLECGGGARWSDMLSRYRGENQIPLMTITKSKGLEYDIVVLLGLSLGEDEELSVSHLRVCGKQLFLLCQSPVIDGVVAIRIYLDEVIGQLACVCVDEIAAVDGRCPR